LKYRHLTFIVVVQDEIQKVYATRWCFCKWKINSIFIHRKRTEKAFHFLLCYWTLCISWKVKLQNVISNSVLQVEYFSSDIELLCTQRIFLYKRGSMVQKKLEVTVRDKYDFYQYYNSYILHLLCLARLIFLTSWNCIELNLTDCGILNVWKTKYLLKICC